MSFARVVLFFAAVHVGWNLVLALPARVGLDVPEPAWLGDLVWIIITGATGYAVATSRAPRGLGALAAILAGLLGVVVLAVAAWLNLVLSQLGQPAATALAAAAQLPPLTSLLTYGLIAGLLGYLGAWVRRDGLSTLLGRDGSADAT